MKLFVVKKTLLCLSLLPVLSFASPTVPKQFQGLWVAKQTGVTCKNADTKGDVKFVSNAKGTYQHEQSCSLKKIRKQSKNSLTADWQCMEEGDEYSQSYTMMINKKHQLLRGGGTQPLQYCGLPPKEPIF